MKSWDGIERRRVVVEGKVGRRLADAHCSQHEILWSFHEKDTTYHRDLVCGKILRIEGNLVSEVEKLERVDAAISAKIEELRNSIVGKYWFRIVVGFLCTGIVGLGVQQNWAFREIIQNQREFSVSVNNIENKQIEMINWKLNFEKEHENLKQRQDILRDRDLKHMDEFHKK
jgi:hypothetical protein